MFVSQCKVTTSFPSPAKHVLDHVVCHGLEPSLCFIPCRAPTLWRELQNLFGIHLQSILLTWSLQLCLCLPTCSNSGPVLSFSIIFLFCFWSHFVQFAGCITNYVSAAVIPVASHFLMVHAAHTEASIFRKKFCKLLFWCVSVLVMVS